MDGDRERVRVALDTPPGKEETEQLDKVKLKYALGNEGYTPYLMSAWGKGVWILMHPPKAS